MIMDLMKWEEVVKVQTCPVPCLIDLTFNSLCFGEGVILIECMQRLLLHEQDDDDARAYHHMRLCNQLCVTSSSLTATRAEHHFFLDT